MKFLNVVVRFIAQKCLGFVIVMFFASSVFSADATVPWNEKTQIGGKAFMQYSYSEHPKGDANAFSLNRFYLTVTSKVADDVNLKLTLDGYPVTSYVKSATLAAPDANADGNVDSATLTATTSTQFYAFIKHALIEIKKSNYSLLLGQHDLPWVPFEEGIWGYRLQGTIFADRMGYLTSTDFGVGLKYKTDNFDTHISLVNGTGWKSEEDNKYKDIHWRLSFGKLSGLLVSGFFSYGWKNQSGDRYRAILQLAKVTPNITIAGEYLQAKDPNTATADKKAKGFSIFGHYSFAAGYPEGSSRLIARYDNIDPDSNTASDKKTLYIFGLANKFRKNVELLLDWESLKYEDGSGKADENKILGQLQVVF